MGVPGGRMWSAHWAGEPAAGKGEEFSAQGLGVGHHHQVAHALQCDHLHPALGGHLGGLIEEREARTVHVGRENGLTRGVVHGGQRLFFAQLRDGTGVVIDVRADDRIEPEDAKAFAATARACESVGWQYRRVGVVDAVLAANVRWLAGYRHPRCRNPRYAGLLLIPAKDQAKLAERIAAAMASHDQ